MSLKFWMVIFTQSRYFRGVFKCPWPPWYINFSYKKRHPWIWMINYFKYQNDFNTNVNNCILHPHRNLSLITFCAPNDDVIWNYVEFCPINGYILRTRIDKTSDFFALFILESNADCNAFFKTKLFPKISTINYIFLRG